MTPFSGRIEIIGSATLYLGDCLDAFPSIGRVQSVITDPPYGIGLTGKLYHSTKRGKTIKRNETYASYDDTQENFVGLILPRLVLALDAGDCGAVFMAERTLPLLPPWVALGGIFIAAGRGLGSWGFQCFMHCAFYGRDPYLAAGMGSRPNGRSGLWPNDANHHAHPCAKPLDAMLWAVNRASLPGQIVLDPFMGSGTTGVACTKLGRPFVGIEIDAAYFDLACERIEDAQRQRDLFIEVPAVIKAKQEAML